MTEKTLFTGFGGQGIISMGQIWGYCAMQEEKNITFFPFYGAEKRGGIARANVIISDDEIASPVISHADSVVVMNQDSLQIAETTIKTGGLMILNETLVKQQPKRTDIRTVKVPATELAGKEGSERAANMVMLGALAVLTGILHMSETETFFKEFFSKEKQNLVPMNVRAVTAGKRFAGNL